MSGSASAWMPFYVGDYLGDTQRLTTEQHGAYLLLMLDYWRAGPAPDDDEVLRQITKLDAKAWKRHRPALARMFQIVDCEWRHKRIDRELEAAESNAERRSEKASKAAQARWGQSSKDASSNAPSMLQAKLVECAPPSPSPKEEEEVSDADASGGEAPPLPPPDPTKVMFDSGILLLGQSGTDEPKARKLLGKWKQAYPPEAVIVALGKAQREGAIDPVSFIEACLKTGDRNGKRHNANGLGTTANAALELDWNAIASGGAVGPG